VIKKVLILLVFVLGLIPAAALAQGAEARMRVSVEVVEGSSITLDQPDQVFLKENEPANLGVITLRGIEKDGVVINSAETLTLIDKNGNEMTVKVQADRKMDSQKNERISYKGEPDGGILSSSYTGRLETTIEYF
jgi:hypothetical protein